MKYCQQIVLKNGKTLILRNGEESDGSAVLENFNLTHTETDYLLSYPDENSFDPEKESQFLKQKAGFIEYGRNPCGFHSRINGFQEIVYMLLEL